VPRREWAISERGYTVVPGPFEGAALSALITDLDRAVANSHPDQIKWGSSGTNVRIDGLLAKLPQLELLFTYAPVVAAAQALIGPHRLSSFHLRTVLPGACAQALHQDVRPGCDGWPLLGFIFMVDAFTPNNGATRFIPRSAGLEAVPAELLQSHPAEVYACGPAGSMILFNGSIWHGFSTNLSGRPRRSVQGSLVPRTGDAAM
jgi:hypothetical protein